MSLPNHSYPADGISKMARTLKVIDWSKHFETSETRKWKQLRWVPISNNLSDPGYLSLVVRDNGAAMLGAWIAILQLASRCKERGILQEGNGTPYTVDTIALVVRMPVELVRQTVALLTTQVRWLEWVGDPDSGVTEDSSAAAGDLTGCIEQNRTERNIDHVCSTFSQRNQFQANTEQGARDARKITATVKPRNAADRKLIAKLCWLKQAGGLSENSIWDAVEGVRLTTKKVRNPIGYLLTCLAEKSKQDMSRLLADAAPSEEFFVACGRAPEPRMVDD